MKICTIKITDTYNMSQYKPVKLDFIKRCTYLCTYRIKLKIKRNFINNNYFICSNFPL